MTTRSTSGNTHLAPEPPPPNANSSTLIEFPRAGRPATGPRPAWRKELSERVREIRQRRALEEAAAGETSDDAPAAAFSFAPELENDDDASEAQGETRLTLGLVPPAADAPPMNPIVAAALKRIERARQQAPAHVPARTRPKAGGAATASAAAVVAYDPLPEQRQEERAMASIEPAARSAEQVTTSTEAASSGESPQQSDLSVKTTEPARVPSLVVVHPAPAAVTEPAANNLTPETAAPRAHLASGATQSTAALKTESASRAQTQKTETTGTAAAAVGNDARATRLDYAPRATGRVLTDRREAEITDAANTVPVVTDTYNDHAPAARRVAAAVVDLLAAACFVAPCAAVIELTSGRWSDPRVQASMAGAALIVTFLYFVVTTGLIGRTFGMSLFSLRAVDERSALVPTTGQSVKRTVFYLLSLATFGLGLLYALFDAEGRTAHDHLSGTVVVHE